MMTNPGSTGPGDVPHAADVEDGPLRGHPGYDKIHLSRLVHECDICSDSTIERGERARMAWGSAAPLARKARDPPRGLDGAAGIGRGGSVARRVRADLEQSPHRLHRVPHGSPGRPACQYRYDAGGGRRYGRHRPSARRRRAEPRAGLLDAARGLVPDGRLAIVGWGWESPENARWEEEHKRFRYTADGWLYDMYLVDPAGGRAANLTAIDRVSFHNSGLFFWPRDPTKLGFQAPIDGSSHPFRMDRDGRNKRDLTKGSREFAYGFGASRDGRRIAYHKSYQVYVADADGSNARHIATGHPFNFAPQWSPDGTHLLFLAGEHENCHPYVADADGTGLRKLADRNGYRGVVEFLDVPDFHSGSSDIPAWSADGTAIFYTARVGASVELFRASLNG
jgi:Tol biopolymer transport system component